MKKTNLRIQKKEYLKPVIYKVKIDKGISMLMQSLPPGDPGSKPANPFK